MRPLAVHALYAVLLFTAGIAAGNKLRHLMSLERVSAGIANAGLNSPELTSADRAVNLAVPAETDQVATTNDRSPADRNTAKEGFESKAAAALTSDQTDAEQELLFSSEMQRIVRSGQQLESVTVKSVSSESDDDGQIRTMIQHLFPEISSAELDAWAAEFAGYDAADLAFLLEQKKQSGLTSVFSDQSPPATLVTKTHSLRSQKDWSSISFSPAIRATFENLQGLHVPGFRANRILMDTVIPSMTTRDQELQEALKDGVQRAAYSGPASDTSLEDLSFRTMRCFDCGELEFTGSPLHVALPPAPELMFLMEDGSVTRRGDFCAVPGGIGIPSSSGIRKAAGISVSEESGRAVWITTTGQVLQRLQNGTEATAGYLQIAEISELTSMTTADGVFFQPPGNSFRLRTPGDDEISLYQRTIERANGTAQDQWDSLDHFRRLESEYERQRPAGVR